MIFFLPLSTAQTLGPVDFFFEARSRYEQRNNLNFDSGLNQNRLRWQNRGRLGFDYDAGDGSRFRVTYQYSNTQTDDGAGFVGMVGQDLVEAYVQREMGGSTMTIGRQPLEIGSGRLVGDNRWGEVGRFWNGVRIENGDVNFFVGRLDVDTAGVGEHYLGVLGYEWGYGGKTNLIYHWSRLGNPSIYTLDHTYTKQYGNLTLDFEGAWQWGREGGQDLEAWAGSVTGKIPVSEKLTIIGGYNTASGGGSGATSNTFNDLFPSDHRFNGIMDLQGWRNVDAFHIGAAYKVNDDMSLKLTYHDFSLNDATDAWYNGRNGLQYGYVDPSGASGKKIGSEIDVSLRLRLQGNLKVTAGFAVFDPGSFVEAQAAASSSQTWFYAGLGWRY